MSDIVERLTKEKDHATQWANKAIEDMKESYEAELAAVRTRCEGLENALQPFADAVYNDNGDIEVNLSVNADDLIRAYFTLRRATLYAIKD